MGTVRGPGRMGHLGFPQTPHLSDTPGDLMLLTTAWRDRPWGLCRECGAGGSRPLAGRAKAAAAGGFHTWPHCLLWPGADGGELTGFDTQHTHPGSSSPIPVPWPSPTPAWPSRGPCLAPQHSLLLEPLPEPRQGDPDGETRMEPSPKP